MADFSRLIFLDGADAVPTRQQPQETKYLIHNCRDVFAGSSEKYTLSRQQTFCKDIDSRFLGLFDTVSSVGWTWQPQYLPCTANHPPVEGRRLPWTARNLDSAAKILRRPGAQLARRPSLRSCAWTKFESFAARLTAKALRIFPCPAPIFAVRPEDNPGGC